MKMLKQLIISLLCILLSACSTIDELNRFLENEDTNLNKENEQEMLSLPNELVEIPKDYFKEASQKGSLVDLYYQSFESKTYQQKSKIIEKHAIVYLPYNYTPDNKYNVFYLMHGGWSNETTWLGSTQQPNAFKNIIDNAIENGEMQPMIIVCPTYNNLSDSDSGDYSLAITLTNNYHNELVNDLIPAVESEYSTYAQDVTLEGIQSSRDHRAFGGFSMGSVATWRAFEHSLNYFRYFMPSSGSLANDAEYLAQRVKDLDYQWNDFFVFAASGTDDFAYSSFKRQIDAMKSINDQTFRFANNEEDGNLYYLEREGGIHSGEYAREYIYNGLIWIWNDN